MKFHISKKGLSVFLGLSMMISSLPVSVSAQENVNSNSLGLVQQPDLFGEPDDLIQ